MSYNPPPFQRPGPPPGFGSPPLPPLPPGQPPAKKTKLGLIIGAVLVVGAVIVVAVLSLGGSDTDDAKAPNGEGASAGLRTVLEDASFDDDGNDDLRACPLGDLDELYDAVAAVIEIDPAVTEGNDVNAASEEGDLPGFVSCERSVEDESEVDRGPTNVFFQAVLDPPRDYQGYITDFGGESTDVTFDDSVQYQGADVEMFCWEANDDNGFTGCDADWVDTTNEIALNVFLGGSDVTTDDAFAALKAVLTIMADNLADLSDAGS